MPGIVSWPGKLQIPVGSVVDAVVSTLDISATILDVASQEATGNIRAADPQSLNSNYPYAGVVAGIVASLLRSLSVYFLAATWRLSVCAYACDPAALMVCINMSVDAWYGMRLQGSLKTDLSMTAAACSQFCLVEMRLSVLTTR